MNKKIINQVKMICLLFGLISGLTCLANSKEAKKSVIVDEVKPSESGKQDVVYCNVSSPVDYLVSSQTRAELIWVMQPNTNVKKGEIIARQNDFFLKNAVQQLSIQVEQAQVNMDFFDKEYRRIRSLPEHLRSQTQLEDGFKQMQQSRLDKQLLKRKLEESEYRLSRLVHKAPVDGEVGELKASLGEHLQVGQPILGLTPTNASEIKCNISYSLYSQSNALENSEFRTDSSFLLRKLRVSQLIDKVTQSMNVYLEFPKTPLAEIGTHRTVGQRFTVVMNSPRENITEVAYDALNFVNNQVFVWTVDKQGVVKKVQVAVVSSNGDRAIIHSSLNGIERVVVKGKKNLKSGDKVKASLEGVENTVKEGISLNGNI